MYTQSAWERGEKYIYTKEPSRCLRGTSSHGIGVYNLASYQALRVSPPGIEWKTGRTPKMGKKWPKNSKWPSARNGGKMAQKCPKNRKMTPKFNPNFLPFWGLFPPCRVEARAIFYFSANFFPFSDFGPFSSLCQAD